MLVISIAYGIFGLSLWFQGSRWGATPAYHNLLEIMRQPEWGTAFAVTSGLLGVAALKRRTPRWLSVLALTVGFAITTGWMFAFMVRWLTSPSTTPETWVSWAVFDYMLIRAAALFDLDEVRLPKRED
jgi:hypothetical protein